MGEKKIIKFEDIAVGQKFTYHIYAGYYLVGTKIDDDRWSVAGASAYTDWYDIVRDIDSVGDMSTAKHEVVDFGQKPWDEISDFPFSGSEADCVEWLMLHQTQRFGKSRFGIQLIPAVHNVVTTTNATITEKDNTMAVYSVIATVKVTRKNEDETLQAVERLVLDTVVVAATKDSAALIAGRRISNNVSDEELSLATVVVALRTA